MSTYTADWFSRAIPAWRQLVLPRLPDGRRRWLELGSHEGRSAEWTLAHALREGDELVCVDLWPDHAVEARFDANVGGHVTKHKGQHFEWLCTAAFAREVYDVVYIDGDHRAQAVIADAVLAWHMLRVGGVLIFDDYLWRHPPSDVGKIYPGPGVDAFLSCFATELILLHKHDQVIVEKRV